MTHAARAAAAVTRDALAALERLRATDLTIAAAYIDTHGAAHLRPVADRLAALAADLAHFEPESTPEPTQSVTSPQESNDG